VTSAHRLLPTVQPFSASLWRDAQDDWRRLWSLDPRPSAFLSPGWVEAWLQSFGSWLEPRLLCWRDPEGVVRGIALMSLKVERLGPLSVRAAYLNTTGEHRVLAEHNRILVEPAYEQAVVDSLPPLLESLDVQVLRLSGFHSADVARYQSAWAGCWRESTPSEDRYVDLRPLHAEPGNYLASLSRNTREQVRRSLKLYEQDGGSVSCEVVQDGDRLAAFDELVALHGALWRSRGKPGAFADPAALAMHRRLLAPGAKDSGVQAELLRIGNGRQCLGYLYNLVSGGHVHFYQSGFRYESDARLKPGLVSHVLAVQHYAALGALEYDFLAGEATASRYKRSLAAQVRHLEWADLYAPRSIARLLLPLRSYVRMVRDYVKRKAS
jgi:CelD/BcsL family acetyltransferase involved in cellulose biosynthesis